MTELTFDVALALYQSQETEQFPIDFNDAWQWLEYTRKDSAKDFLVANFIKGIDFVSFPGETGKLGGRPLEKIRITVTCLKEWGMMAGTAKGKEIRRYFIECERIAKNQAQSFAAPDDFSQFGQYAEAARLLKAAQFVDYDPIEFLNLHMKLQEQSQSVTQQVTPQSMTVETRLKPDRKVKARFAEIEVHESVDRWFNECVEQSPEGSVQQGKDPGNSDQLFGHYYQWCEHQAIQPVSHTRFGLMFRLIASKRWKVKPIKPQNKMTFRGLRLR